MDRTSLVAAAIAGLLAVGANSALAQNKSQEKCWGVAKASTCVQMGGSLTQGKPGKLAMEKKG